MSEELNARKRIVVQAWGLIVVILVREFSASENGIRHSAPIMFAYAVMRNGLYFFIVVFPVMVYVAQRIGVSRSTRIPVRKVGLFWKVIEPPVMTVRVPAAATAIPMVWFLLRFSLSMREESTVIRIGDSRQTRIAAIEAFVRAMPVTCVMKKNVIPVSASRISRGRSLLSMCSG